jgi:hypothetical protein
VSNSAVGSGSIVFGTIAMACGAWALVGPDRPRSIPVKVIAFVIAILTGPAPEAALPFGAGMTALGVGLIWHGLGSDIFFAVGFLMIAFAFAVAIHPPRYLRSNAVRRYWREKLDIARRARS